MSKMTPGSADETGETTGPLGTSGTLTPPRPAVPDDLRDGPEAGSRMDALVAWTAAHPRVPLLAALILAVVARAYLIIRTNAMLDGDEALVGIQAERILHGQYPTYFYAQPYMGSLEAYLAAALFRLFGPSAWALRAVPVALSLLLVYLTWHLARALLPPTSRAASLLAGLAALFAAVPPLYDAVAELRTWGGQIEVYVITMALLLVSVELARRLWARAGAFELARRWALLGVVAGVGIWINPLVSYALLTCALWLLPPLLVRTFPHLAARIPVLARRLPPAESSEPGAATNTPGAGALVPALALLPGLAIGGLPAWIYAVHHSAENLLLYIQQPSVSPTVSGAARHGRLFLGAAITARYATCVAPRVLAGGLPAETRALLPLRLALLLPPLAAVVCAVWLAWRRASRPLLIGLPLLYAGVVTAVFCLGTSAWGATKDCALDYAGRYAVPLALVEPLLLLALFALPAVWTSLGALGVPGSRRNQMAAGTPLGNGDVLQPSGAHVAPRWQRQWWTLALFVLLAGGILQLGTYAFVNPATTFQSPYFRRVALDQSELLDYLRSHGIHYAWANHWVGNIVTFETDGQTTCADYYDQVVQGGLQRPPGTLEAVSRAVRPSFIITLADPYPLLARELDAQHIPYTIAVLKRSGVTVITPARTVDPASVVPGLGQDYPY